MSTYFFFIFLITIFATRLFLFLRPIPAPTIGKFRTHHYMFGLLGMVVGLFTHSVLISAIGLGLFVDELTYILIGGKTHADNYSKISLLGTLFFIVLVFIFRNNLIYILQNSI
jgi:hypothetical protein